MEITKIPFSDVPQFSERDKAYTLEDPALRPFFKHPVQLSSFSNIINDKSQNFQVRKITSEYINKQYEELIISSKLASNLDTLNLPDSYTIVTGHQPSLATGPLYFIYKIASIINLTEQLKKEYPEKNFIPVFWLGSEDHDFDEINHFQLFNQRFTWEQNEAGPVGKLSTENIRPLLPDLFDKLGDRETAIELKTLLEKSYGSFETLDEATFQLVHDLFQKHGLVIIQANDPQLKRAFIPILEKELFGQDSEPIVQKTINQLEELGYKGQASPRPINLFYMKPGLRERIVREGSDFIVLNTDLKFSESEMKDELNNHPEHFSPNVIIRPLYQEFLLPNLAYVGGGEIAYWLERKAQFEHFGIPFPMLIRRSSALWVDKGSKKKMDKLNLSIEDLLQEEETLIKQFVKEQSDSDFQFQPAYQAVKEGFQFILKETEKVDPTLIKTVKAEESKAIKSLDQLKGRLIKAEKRNQEIAVNQIRSLKEKLFPGRGLQERKDNFMGLYLKHGREWIDLMVETLDPMERVLYVFEES